MNKISLAVSPILWRNDDLPELGKDNSFEKCIKEAQLCGYSGCEKGRQFLNDRVALKKILSQHDLTLCASWLSTYILNSHWEDVLKSFTEQCQFLQYMGSRSINVSEQSNSIQKSPLSILSHKVQYTSSEWKILSEGMNQLGKIARAHELYLCVHHHAGTGVETEEEIDYLMQETDPQYVFLLYDPGHLVFSSQDYQQIYIKHKNRIRHIHFKDVRSHILEKVRKEKKSFLDAVCMGVFTIPGDGDIDFTFFQDKLEGYDGWIVIEAEQDPSIAHPLSYAQKAYHYMKEKFGIQ